MGLPVKGYGIGGNGCPDIGQFLPHSDSGGAKFLYQICGWCLHESGGRWEAFNIQRYNNWWDRIRYGMRTGVPPPHPTGDGDGRSGLGGGGDIHIHPLEQNLTVYCDQTHHGSMSGLVAMPWALFVT